jgi:hypothetical protein
VIVSNDTRAGDLQSIREFLNNMQTLTIPNKRSLRSGRIVTSIKNNDLNIPYLSEKSIEKRSKEDQLRTAIVRWKQRALTR